MVLQIRNILAKGGATKSRKVFIRFLTLVCVLLGEDGIRALPCPVSDICLKQKEGYNW